MNMNVITHEVVNIKFREGKGERYEVNPGGRTINNGILTLYTTQDRTVIIPVDVIRAVHVVHVFEGE